MAREVPTREPTSLVAGDSWQWDVTLADFPPSEGWELSYTVRGPEDLDIKWSTHINAVGATYEVRVPASATNLSPAGYKLFGFVTKGTERFVVYGEADGEGVLNVRPNPSAAVNALSHDETVLAAIDATIIGQATDSQKVIQINGRRVESWDSGELIKFQNIYRARVLAARNPEALTPKYEVVF